MNKLAQRLSWGSSLVAISMAMCAPAVALAQAPADAASAAPIPDAAPPAPARDTGPVGEIVVTGSRVARAGFTAPTPVTVIQQEMLKAQPLLSDSLKELPTLQATTGPAQQRNGIPGAGKAQLNLRNLGIARTLVLLDGKRFVTAGDTGAPDVSQFPASLVDRVDVVTGGASAAYGSDAVAGVVNFVLNKKFQGLKGSVEGGLSQRGDNANNDENIAFGTGWGPNNRGHLLLSYEHSNFAAMQSRDRDFTSLGVGYVTFPGQTPLRRVLVNVRHSDADTGGLVVTGPLKGLTFGAGGAPRQFVYGSNVTSVNMVGGEGPISLLGPNMGIGTPLTRDITFGRVSYDVAPDWNLYSELNWGVNKVLVHGGYNYATGSSTAPLVTLDNPYLPASVRAQMVALGQQSFRVNKIFADLPDFNPNVTTGTIRSVVGVDGKIGIWTTQAYFTYGVSDAHYHVEGMLNNVNFYQAVDAVRNPAGAIVCRSTLTSPNNGCVPYNVLGTDGNSKAAIDYVTGTVMYRQYVTQGAGGLSFSGEPFKLPAGPVSVAFGIEARRETLQTTRDLEDRPQLPARQRRALPADPLARHPRTDAGRTLQLRRRRPVGADRQRPR
jgi:iron complex outermembrane receptor protein